MFADQFKLFNKLKINLKAMESMSPLTSKIYSAMIFLSRIKQYALQHIKHFSTEGQSYLMKKLTQLYFMRSIIDKTR